MADEARRKWRIPRRKTFAVTVVSLLAAALIFAAFPLYRQYAIVSAFRARGFFLTINDGYPPGWLSDLLPSNWRESVSSEWCDAFGYVNAIAGPGDPGKEFTDNDFAALRSLPYLRELDLGHSAITDAGLSQLEQMTQLKYLLLDNTQIGDAGVTHLSNLTNLKVLHLGNTRITDAALLQLEEMEELRKLSVQKTRVTKDGVAKLRKALPDLSQVITVLEGVE
jgi:Leucine Rich repeat